MQLKIVNKLGNPLPTYKTAESAGMDLHADLMAPITLRPMERKLILTGLFMQIPEGYEGQVRSRSGLAMNEGIIVLNAPGTIDSDYRGEIGALLINLSHDAVTINHGDRIAQIVFSKHERAMVQEVDVLNETMRGENGWGHTGK